MSNETLQKRREQDIIASDEISKLVDLKVLQEKRDNLVKAIEGADFILTGIELSAMSRTPTEEPLFTFEVKGFCYGKLSKSAQGKEVQQGEVNDR
jgi:hypothetical protein